MQVRNSKSRSLSLLNESTFRSAMTNLYVSIMEATENAEELLSHEPGEITWSMTHGNQITKKCMTRLCWWLDNLKNFAFQGQVFEIQILQPIKIVAEFITEIRKEKFRTSEITGFVFSKSRPYFDVHSNFNRVTISMVVSSLRNVVSIRCSEESARKIALGRFYVFEQVQPLPLANRLHQSHPVIKECGDIKPTLSEYDFLKISFDDMESLSRSVEMENFTEVASSQSELRHSLGAVFVVSGKVVHVRESRITLQNVQGNNTSTMVVSSQLYDNIALGSLGSFEGKFVRMLVCCWYDSGSEPEDYQKSLEVFHMENVEDQSEVIMDDLQGYVRLRGKASKKTVGERYPEIQEGKFAKLTSANDFLTPLCEKPEEDISAKFVEADSKIRGLRLMIKTEEKPAILIDDILDPERVSTEILLRKLKADENLRNLLLSVLRMKDEYGITAVDSDIVKNPDHDTGKMVWWLSFAGLVSENNHSISLTREGFDMLYNLLKGNLRELVEKARRDGIVSIPELEKMNAIPSLMIKFLREEGEMTGIVPYVDHGVRCELFWMDKRSNDLEHLRSVVKSRVAELIHKTLAIFRNARYPLTTKKVVEELKKNNNMDLTYHSANSLLSKLAREKKLVVSGESWEYDLETRIVDFMSEESEKVFSEHVICEKTSIPPIEIQKVRSFLHDLGKKRLATEIRPNLWTFSSNPKDRCKEFLKSLLKEFVVKFLKNSRGSDMERLTGVVGYQARELCEKSICKNAYEITNEVIKEMVKQNEIIVEDGICKLTKHGSLSGR
ncbi:MAG TPA: hypothetical protein VJ792_07285 [Candidatus Nitrosotalea sp.]|nr:hypothetical protein [Candidatus Nitrosotalea sp.]